MPLGLEFIMSREAVNKILSLLLLPALFTTAGWFANHWYERHYQPTEKRIKQSGFSYVSPLLDVELPEGYGVRREPIPFKQKVKKFVDQQIKAGNVREMSVYYRDLSDGPWFGINEKVAYNPASMMKVSLMIAWLKRAEKDPSVLQRKLAFDEKAHKGRLQILKPGQSIKSGVSYTVEDLIRYMIQYSDNKAMLLLNSNMTAEDFRFINNNMDVNNEPDTAEYTITVKSYSGFLRILYNASFLNREMSEKALELMSHEEFPYGIVAGIPKGVKLASKFGEFVREENPGDIQLHEFGIVYHPKGPYILGVLTRGNNWKGQADVIKSLSELVYNSINLTQ